MRKIELIELFHWFRLIGHTWIFFEVALFQTVRRITLFCSTSQRTYSLYSRDQWRIHIHPAWELQEHDTTTWPPWQWATLKMYTSTKCIKFIRCQKKLVCKNNTSPSSTKNGMGQILCECCIHYNFQAIDETNSYVPCEGLSKYWSNIVITYRYTCMWSSIRSCHWYSIWEHLFECVNTGQFDMMQCHQRDQSSYIHEEVTPLVQKKLVWAIRLLPRPAEFHGFSFRTEPQ